MMRYILAFLLYFVLAVSSVYGVLEKRYIFEPLSPEAGFCFDDISAIVTDRKGFVWFGTSSAVYYYNNKEVKKYKSYIRNGKEIVFNHVKSLYFDSSNTLWVSTQGGIIRYDSQNDIFEQFMAGNTMQPNINSFIEYDEKSFLIVMKGKVYRMDHSGQLSALKLPSTVRAVSIVKDENRFIYVGFENGHIYKGINPNSDFELIYEPEKKWLNCMYYNYGRIYSGYRWSGMDVISTEGDLEMVYSKETSEDSHRLSSNTVKHIVADNSGNIILSTDNGLNVIGYGGCKFINMSNSYGMSHNTIFSLHVDNNNNLWIGTWAGGLSVLHKYGYRFNKVVGDENNNIEGVVSALERYDDDNILVGSGSGLSLYNLNSSKYTRRIDGLFVKSIEQDSEGNFWIGTVNQGLHFLKGNTISKVKLDDRIDNKVIISYIKSQGDTLWISTRGRGLVNYNIKTGKHHFYPNVYDDKNVQLSNMIWQIEVARSGELLICTDMGLCVKDKSTDKFVNYVFNKEVPSDNRCCSLCELEDGLFLVGTYGHGVVVFDMNKKEFVEFEGNSSIDELDIYSMNIDSQGHLWMSSNERILLYDIHEKKMQRFSMADGLIGNVYAPLSSAACAGGTYMFWGSNNGFNYINIEDIKKNIIYPEAYVVKISVNNRNILNYDEVKTNSRNIADIQYIELPPHLNTIVFTPSSNNFLKSYNNSFKYKLEGYDKDFITIANSQMIVYTQLPSGSYKLLLYGSNNDGVWSEKPYQIDIVVLTPIWKRWYMILVYIASISMLVYFVVKDRIKKIMLRQEIRQEKYQNEVDRNSYNEKVKFFMNISHEFRTPLNLISMPLSMLEKDLSLSNSAHEHVNAIKRNTVRLSKLINQILDFRLMEVGKLKPEFKPVNIVSICKQVYSYFDYQLREKSIKFVFESSSDIVKANLDSDLIEKTVYNLLGNAIKYSTDGGEIKLSVRKMSFSLPAKEEGVCVGEVFEGDGLEISVENEGHGIPEELLPNIFDRFFNVNNHAESSGIGLHLCQEYVRFHHGYIIVTSVVDGKTCFRIRIPSDNVESNDEKPVCLNISFDKEEDADYIETKKSDAQPLLLIVDDNTEASYYLKTLLVNRYKCMTAKNGKLGLDMTKNLHPDLIISDLSMPLMNGMELLKVLKGDENVKDIPFILVTAIDDTQIEIDAIKNGANAVLNKPIDEKLLLTHIQNCLNKTKVQHASLAPEGKKNEIAINATFMQKVELILSNNLQDCMFDTEALAEQLNISRSSLHRKIKAETNMSTSELIRDYRLEAAAKLIAKGMRNINEVSIYVGFNSTSYFCRSFKKKYELTPLEYYTKYYKKD